MGKIIALRDEIKITIDNTKQPGQVAMSLSRDMPAPYVAMIMGQLIVRMMGDLISGISQNLSSGPSNGLSEKEGPNGSA